MPKRLLLLCPTSTYRAEAFVNAAKQLPIELSIASEHPSALSHLHPVALPAFDFSDEDAVVAFARDFGGQHRIDAVVPVDDQATMAAAIVARELNLPHSRPDAVYAAINKFHTRQRLLRAGLPTPDYRLVHIDDDPVPHGDAIGFPVVIKPLMMAASRGVIRANNGDELRDAFARVADIVRADDAPDDEEARSHVLIESFIPGWEVAVEGIVTNGRLDVVAIFDKPDPLDGPYFPETIYVTPSRLSVADQQLIHVATAAALDAIGLDYGPIHAEIRGNEEGAYLIEVAARSIGGLCSKVVQFEGGRSLETVILEHALGIISSPPPRERAASGVMMMQSPRAGALERVDGLEAARAVPGVDEVIISAHPGKQLKPLPEGFLYLGFIFAHGATPDDVERSLRASFDCLNVVLV